MSELEPTRTYSNLTATDVLRRMLDERGVEWGNIRNDGSESDYLTEWQFENNQGKAIAIEWAVGSGLSVEIHRYHLTPEQAIDATLGSCNCSDNCTNSERTETCQDLVHVVRCRDCKFYEPNTYSHFTCELLTFHVEPDGFCAWGERKESE